MKGITLPVNVLVLVAIAVIVLMGLVGLYFTGFSPFGQASGVESVKNEACRDLLIVKRCLNATNTIKITKFDANKNGVNDSGTNWNWGSGTGDDNLAALCYNYFGARNESQCKSVCTCVGMGISGGDGGSLPPGCTCPGGWQNGACGTGGCIKQREQTRTCNPVGCAPTSRCVADAACVSSCSWQQISSCGCSDANGNFHEVRCLPLSCSGDCNGQPAGNYCCPTTDGCASIAKNYTGC